MEVVAAGLTLSGVEGLALEEGLLADITTTSASLGGSTGTFTESLTGEEDLGVVKIMLALFFDDFRTLLLEASDRLRS